MNTMNDARSNPLKQFWDKLDDHHTVMLASPDPTQFMQPMTANGAREEGSIWFYTKRDTDLAEASANGGTVHLCVIDQDHGYFASVAGHLILEYSERHIDRYWNAVVDAWFPDGKSDPKLTMLKFTPERAAIWVSGSGNLFKFGWNVARANLNKEEPDIGMHTILEFPKGLGVRDEPASQTDKQG